MHELQGESVCTLNYKYNIVDSRLTKERFIIIGMDAFSRILVVIYTLRDDEIRLISARKATQNERRQYEEG